MQVISYFPKVNFSQNWNSKELLLYDVYEHTAFMDVLAFVWSGLSHSLSHHMLNCQLM